MLTAHYREIVGLTVEEFEQMKASPAWPERLATAHTLPREMRAEEEYRFDAQRFTSLTTPTMLLLGSKSPQRVKAATEQIASALPHSRVVVLPGQEHIAMYTAPELILREVRGFLTGPVD